jgi:phosphatidylinositol alpha 1,6-mannosyltransferase
MRIAIVTESFLPNVNGVTNSILRILDHLADGDHEAIVVAPGVGPERHGRFAVHRVASIGLPFYRDFNLALPTPRLEAVLRDFAPDVVHLASPFAFGAYALRVARLLGIPTVAVFQTDVAGFVSQYGLEAAGDALWRWVGRLHSRADLTLAPSSHSIDALHRAGVERVELWRRGVDATRYSPRHRDAALRARLAPEGETIVGFVGRLAAEKCVEDLAVLGSLPRVRIVVVGDGPARRRLERTLPTATFLGFRSGLELSQLYASLDLFVHTGPHETFCQAVQEALASGVPVIAPARGGPVDLVQPGVTGALYEVGDLVSLRDLTAGLVASPRLRASMGAAARASVIARTWRSVGVELERHWRRAADRVRVAA